MATKPLMLDETRPYGVVYGPSSHRFEQDGLRFDARKICMDQEETETVIPSVAPSEPELDVSGLQPPYGQHSLIELRQEAIDRGIKAPRTLSKAGVIALLEHDDAKGA